MSLLRSRLSSQTTRQLPTAVMKRNYMEGMGGRYENNRKIPQGLTVKSLKHHYALLPLFITMTLGMGWVVYFCGRSLTSHVDVNWRKKEEPWETYRHKQFKFFNPSDIDYKTACKAPDYKS